MPNATVRANARPMSEDRRAVLRSTLAVGAIGVTPIAAAAELPPESDDAELFALFGAVGEAKARRLAATVTLVSSGISAASERQEALLGRELDLLETIPGTRAQTVAGALAKMALVADYHDDPTFGSEDDFLDWECGFRILLSAALDLKRLGTA
jgi:hypothetical protein